ncbi:MAG: anthranilate synthase component I [Gammaproteobacteria bacterium]|nr:anthranilate synthase component I [Gammaproteobacteria bacterium]
MNQQQFDELHKLGFNRIPLMREVLADLDTPLSVYLKLAHGPYSYLFESVQGGEKWGRYSIIGLATQTRLEVRENHIRIFDGEQCIEEHTHADPLEFIDGYQARFKVPDVEGLPRFTGGLVGYFGYDTVRYIEPRLGACKAPDPIDNPDIVLMLSDEVVVFDNLKGKLFLLVHADPAQNDAYKTGQRRLETLAARLAEPVPASMREPRPTQAIKEEDFVSGFTQEGFEHAVRRIKDYIVEGDTMQVVISQRLSVPFDADPLDLYRALRSFNPSPYMYYMNMGDFYIVGSSPEILVRLEDGVVTVRPIAGTRHRGKTEAEDKMLEQDLLSDPKELAEHLMLIDLGRNDAGRVAEIGSVNLTDKMVIERYSHVMHIVSNVTGKLKDGMDAIDVIRATFPAGTVSGAPKVRAMEIIDELEPVKRGVYSGAVGYIGWNGNMDTAIAIRTAVIKDQTLYMQAGAGIVYDSVPSSEWEETMNKSRAIFRAATLAANGLNDTKDGHR